MFPRIRQHALAGLDTIVELATLGEYGVDEHGAPMALEPEAAPVVPGRRTRGGCDGPAPARGCASARRRGVPAAR